MGAVYVCDLYLIASYSEVHHKSINAGETIGGSAAGGHAQRPRAAPFRQGHPTHQGALLRGRDQQGLLHPHENAHSDPHSLRRTRHHSTTPTAPRLTKLLRFDGGSGGSVAEAEVGGYFPGDIPQAARHSAEVHER